MSYKEQVDALWTVYKVFEDRQQLIDLTSAKAVDKEIRRLHAQRPELMNHIEHAEQMVADITADKKQGDTSQDLVTAEFYAKDLELAFKQLRAAAESSPATLMWLYWRMTAGARILHPKATISPQK